MLNLGALHLALASCCCVVVGAVAATGSDHHRNAAGAALQSVLSAATDADRAAAWVLDSASGRATKLTGAGGCLKLATDMCKPCPASEANDCERVTAQCNDLFCSPLCLTTAWDCTVKATGAMAAAITAPEKAVRARPAPVAQ